MEWYPVLGGKYFINEAGEVRNEAGRQYKKHRRGYYELPIGGKRVRRSVNRLMAKAFGVSVKEFPDAVSVEIKRGGESKTFGSILSCAKWLNENGGTEYSYRAIRWRLTVRKAQIGEWDIIYRG